MMLRSFSSMSEKKLMTGLINFNYIVLNLNNFHENKPITLFIIVTDFFFF